MQCGSSKDPATGKWKPYFHSIGDVSSIKLADARAEGQRRKADARIQVVPDAGNPTAAVIDTAAIYTSTATSIGKARLEPDGHSDAFLADTSLEEVLKFYEDNRNCAPSSKRTMALLIRKHLMKWLHKPIFTIDALMLQTRYKEVIAQVKADGVARSKRYAQLPEKERLLRAPDGYYTGIKTANDVIEGFGRIYRYWTAKHMTRLQRAGILVPVCPTVALLDDLEPEPKRVKGIPIRTISSIRCLSDFYLLAAFEWEWRWVAGRSTSKPTVSSFPRMPTGAKCAGRNVTLKIWRM
jgi:hypothetical protein